MMTLNAAHLLGVEAEQLGGEDQVPGRGDRQEFGDALDDAEDDRDQEDWHRLSRVQASPRRSNEFAGRRSGRPAEAAEPFVADRGERRRLDPERFEARAARRDGTLSRCSISHWSRVSGAPGSQPSRDKALPKKSGMRHDGGRLAGERRGSRW